jgi:hypothetical protein
MRQAFCLAGILLLTAILHSEESPSNSGCSGLNLHLGNLSRLSRAKTRSISPENYHGEKGAGGKAGMGTGVLAARELGQGWKVSPSFYLWPGKILNLAEMKGPGAINHIWLTTTGNWRFLVLRFFWDGETTPSVEVPLGDFFASGWGKVSQVSSMAVCVNPGNAFNCYWEMPFRKSCKITLENLDSQQTLLYYQIDYTLTEIPSDAAYFHAQFRRSNPLPMKTDHVILDGVKGWGQYVGTYMAWGVHSRGWWGEGEIKFFMDGDERFPTIRGTGTEDYFCGSYNFENQETHQYQEFTTPYSGMAQVIRPDGLYQPQQRFGLYRWHILDPIRFEKDLRVTIQALGWRSEGRYLPLEDDISSVGYWYQAEPHAPFPPLPSRDGLEIN